VGPAKKRLLSKVHPLGVALLLAFFLVAVLADVISPYDPWQRFGPYLPPQAAHWLGTNDLGNDILSELLHATRVSLLVGLATSAIATALGLLIGLLSGYFRGPVDELLMGFTDVMLMIPRIPMVIILAAFLKTGYGVMVLVLGLLWWTTTARVVRSKVLQVRESAFVSAQRTLGFSHLRIMLSDILPNILHVLSPKFMLTVASAMIAEASLSFLGLGDPGVKSWGMMIRFAFQRGGFIRQLWWWYTAPGLAITLCVLSLVLIGFTAGKEEPVSAALTD
jgi:peptide/nickel transport system permease protein